MGGEKEVRVSGRREVLWVSKRGKGPLVRIEKNGIKARKRGGKRVWGKGRQGMGRSAR